MRVLALFGSGILIAFCGGAQTTGPTASEPTIRTTASEVMLDIVVRDKHGKPVKNLKPGDIEIYEDGVRQDVRSFRFAGTRERETQETAPATAGARASSSAPPAARSLAAVNLICIVFHNLDPMSRTRASEIVQEFLKNDLAPNTYVGMFTLDDRITPVLPFTNKKSELEKAARDIFNLTPMAFAEASEPVLTANPTEATVDVAVSGSGPGTTATATLNVTGGEISPRVITGADVGTGFGNNVQRGARVAEQRDFSHINGMRQSDEIINMLRVLGTLPGRKSVLLVSTGLVTTGDPDRFQSILDKANQSGITVYALDVAGLNTTDTALAGDIGVGRVATVSRSQGAINSSLSAMKEKSRQGDTMNDAVRSSNTQSSLRALAEGSGGFLIANTNEFKKPFQRIIDDVDAHYEVTYHPASDKPDGHFRKIEVKLARAGLTAESRAGYFVLPENLSPLQPHETLGMAVLNAKPLPHAFDFRTALFRFRNSGAVPENELVIEVPGSALTVAPKPERASGMLHASVLALVKDASGQVVDKFSVDAPFEIPAANLAAVRTMPLTYTHPLKLPPGRYTVETAAMDREGARASTAVLSFESTEPRQGVALSSAVLLQRVEPAAAGSAADPLVYRGRRLVPFIGSQLGPDAKPYLYFVVYPDPAKRDKPKLRVEFHAEGREMANQTVDLPAADASGAIPMLIHAATHPGECELKITAVQGDQSTTESVRYTIEAK